LRLSSNVPAMGHSPIRVGLVVLDRDAAHVRSLPAGHDRLHRPCARGFLGPVGTGGGATARLRGAGNPPGGANSLLPLVHQLLPARSPGRADRGDQRVLGRVAWSGVLAHDDRHRPCRSGDSGSSFHPERRIDFSCFRRIGASFPRGGHSQRASGFRSQAVGKFVRLKPFVLGIGRTLWRGMGRSRIVGLPGLAPASYEWANVWRSTVPFGTTPLTLGNLYAGLWPELFDPRVPSPVTVNLTMRIYLSAM
jgi:hypothetical protein